MNVVFLAYMLLAIAAIVSLYIYEWNRTLRASPITVS